MATIRDTALALAFLATIALPGSLHLLRAPFGSPGVLDDEQRLAAPFPDLSALAGDPRNFFDGINAWLQDRVGLRPELLAVGTAIKDAGRLNAGNNVVIGRSGWLFLTANDLISDIEHNRSDDAEKAQAWTDALTEVRALFGPDTVFRVLLAANKQSVYPEYLPAHVRAEPARTRAEVLVPALLRAGLPVTDSRHSLRATKRMRPDDLLYYPTDTHWSDYGAYVAYRTLMADLSQTTGIAPPVVTLEDLQFQERAEPFEGDLSRLLGTGRFDRDVPRLRVRAPTPTERILVGGDEAGTFAPSIYRQDVDGPRLLVSGDSFVEALVPFLRESFSEVVIVRREGRNIDLEALRPFDPEVVVFEVVERMFGETPALTPPPES